MTTYDYYYTVSANGTLEVEDKGNCAIEANTDEGDCYYLVTTSSFGKVSIFVYGPINPDFDELPDKVECTFNRFDFSDYKIDKAINKLLSIRGITQARCLEIDEALDKCKNIIEYMRGN